MLHNCTEPCCKLSIFFRESITEFFSYISLFSPSHFSLFPLSISLSLSLSSTSPSPLLLSPHLYISTPIHTAATVSISLYPLTLTGMNCAMSLSYEALSFALISDSAFLQLSIVPRMVIVLSMLYAVRSFNQRERRRGRGGRE